MNPAGTGRDLSNDPHQIVIAISVIVRIILFPEMIFIVFSSGNME
jgi:hypothetical protein